MIARRFTIVTGADNPVLRTVCRPVDQAEFSAYARLAEEMVRYVKNLENGSAGLAAPQIGESVRILVATLFRARDDESARTVAMINPEVLEYAPTMSTETEGCLSLPGVFDRVTRPDAVKVRYTDPQAKVVTLWIRGFASHVVQHEIDHLDGILFIDRIANSKNTAQSTPISPMR